MTCSSPTSPFPSFSSCLLRPLFFVSPLCSISVWVGSSCWPPSPEPSTRSRTRSWRVTLKALARSSSTSIVPPSTTLTRSGAQTGMEAYLLDLFYTFSKSCCLECKYYFFFLFFVGICYCSYTQDLALFVDIKIQWRVQTQCSESLPVLVLFKALHWGYIVIL